MSDIHKLPNEEYISFEKNNVYTFSVDGRGTSSTSSNTKEFGNWHKSPISIEDYIIIPYGDNNDLPNEIMNAVYPNHLAPRHQKRKVELLWGEGPYLYNEKTDGENRTRIPIENAAIEEWLESINYDKLLLDNCNEYYYMSGVFSKIKLNKGSRIGLAPEFASTEPISNVNCRFAYHRSSKTKIPTHVIVGDHSAHNNEELKVYPLFDKKQPYKHAISIDYYAFGSFGMPDYSLPEIYGALNWIRNSTSIPVVIKAHTKNALSIKWHITSPAKYWKDAAVILEKNCKATGKIYSNEVLEAHKKDILANISKLLSGEENVGKFWHNEKVVKLVGSHAQEEGWEIKPIEQKVKDYIKAQLDVAKHADFAVAAATGLHPALANVGADGKSDSGSEQVYAFINHQKSSTNIPELVVTKTLNDVIKLKFNTKTKVGFFKVPYQTLDEITPSERPKNEPV